MDIQRDPGDRLPYLVLVKGCELVHIQDHVVVGVKVPLVSGVCLHGVDQAQVGEYAAVRVEGLDNVLESLWDAEKAVAVEENVGEVRPVDLEVEVDDGVVVLSGIEVDDKQHILEGIEWWELVQGLNLKLDGSLLWLVLRALLERIRVLIELWLALWA